MTTNEQRIVEHLYSHPDHRDTDWGAWAPAEELERLTTVELHTLAHSAQAFIHFSDDLRVPR